MESVLPNCTTPKMDSDEPVKMPTVFESKNMEKHVVNMWKKPRRPTFSHLNARRMWRTKSLQVRICSAGRTCDLRHRSEWRLRRCRRDGNSDCHPVKFLISHHFARPMNVEHNFPEIRYWTAENRGSLLGNLMVRPNTPPSCCRLGCFRKLFWHFFTSSNCLTRILTTYIIWIPWNVSRVGTSESYAHKNAHNWAAHYHHTKNDHQSGGKPLCLYISI